MDLIEESELFPKNGVELKIEGAVVIVAGIEESLTPVASGLMDANMAFDVLFADRLNPTIINSIILHQYRYSPAKELTTAPVNELVKKSI